MPLSSDNAWGWTGIWKDISNWAWGVFYIYDIHSTMGSEKTWQVIECACIPQKFDDPHSLPNLMSPFGIYRYFTIKKHKIKISKRLQNMFVLT